MAFSTTAARVGERARRASRTSCASTAWKGTVICSTRAFLIRSRTFWAFCRTQLDAGARRGERVARCTPAEPCRGHEPAPRPCRGVRLRRGAGSRTVGSDTGPERTRSCSSRTDCAQPASPGSHPDPPQTVSGAWIGRQPNRGYARSQDRGGGVPFPAEASEPAKYVAQLLSRFEFWVEAPSVKCLNSALSK